MSWKSGRKDTGRRESDEKPRTSWQLAGVSANYGDSRGKGLSFLHRPTQLSKSSAQAGSVEKRDGWSSLCRGTARAGIKIKGKIKVKGSGQECPLYTSYARPRLFFGGNRGALVCAFEQARGRGAEDEAAYVGEVRYSSGLGMCYLACAEELGQEPEAD